jgi:hypothetical protein
MVNSLCLASFFFSAVQGILIGSKTCELLSQLEEKMSLNLLAISNKLMLLLLLQFGFLWNNWLLVCFVTDVIPQFKWNF